MTLLLKGLADIDTKLKIFNFETSLGENLEIRIRSPLGLQETLEYTNDLSEISSKDLFDEDGKPRELSDEDRTKFASENYEKVIHFTNKWLNILGEDEFTEQEILTAYKIVTFHNKRNLILEAILKVGGDLRKKTDEDENDDIPFLLADS